MRRIWTEQTLMSHGNYLVKKYGYLPNVRMCKCFGEKRYNPGSVKKYFGSMDGFRAALGATASCISVLREQRKEQHILNYKRLCREHKNGGYLNSAELESLDKKLFYSLKNGFKGWTNFMVEVNNVSAPPDRTICIGGRKFQNHAAAGRHYGKRGSQVTNLVQRGLSSDEIHQRLSKKRESRKPNGYWGERENVLKEVSKHIVLHGIPDGQMPLLNDLDAYCAKAVLNVFGSYAGLADVMGRSLSRKPCDQYHIYQSMKKKLDLFEQNLVEMVKALGEHVHDLPKRDWLLILRMSEALELSERSALKPIKMRLLQGELNPEDIIPPAADPQAAPDAPPPESKLRQMLNDLRAGTLNDSQETVTAEGETVENVSEDSEERRQYLLNLSPQRILDTVSASAKATTNEKALNSIAHGATERYWKRTLGADDPATVADEIRAAVPEDKWASLVRDRFLSDWTLIEQLGDVPGFKPSGDIQQLNLMQVREAALLRRNRRRLNISGMGAGKTMAALAGVSVAGCERVLVLCPNNSINSWVGPLRENFPDAAIATKTWEPQFQPGTPQFLICNHEMLSDYGLDRLAECVAAFNPDAAVVDELHLCKVRTKATESQRHRNLKALLDDMRDRDAVIYGMTGTPVVNELQEAISLLAMVDPDAAEGLDPKHTVDNCLAVHQALQPISSRYVPPLPCPVIKSTIEVRADHLLDETVAACMRSPVTADAVLTQAKASALVRLAAEPGKLMVFTSAVTGVVDEMRDALERAGIRAVIHTGGEKTDGDVASVEAFQLDPSVKVLLASTATLATGLDGLQKFCGRVCFLTLPWTASEHDQAVARILRQKTNFDSVELTYLVAVLKDPETGEDWSLDRMKLDRLTNKRTIADAVCDGVIPDRAALQLTESKVRRGLKKWATRISQTEVPCLT